MTFYQDEGGAYGRAITSANPMAKFSTGLDSIRPYQWEVEFAPAGVAGTYLTVAAKQVSEMGFTVEDIEVHRANDRYYYPGKATPEEVTITFDNLKQNPLGGQEMAIAELYKWVQGTYDPLTGDFGDIKTAVKSNIVIHQLDGDLAPIASVTLYGAYPKSFKTAEYNYATATDMHTLTVSFRYDFMSAEKA
tara:strand:+ start:265 stop:837 length:573 start_codon:yes stop_codon:yes gene_type:complete